MPSDPFAEVHIKINRGDEHLKSLYDLIRTWGESEPYEFLLEQTEERTFYGFRIKFTDPPDFSRWGAITGDVLTNYRAALDYMVHALAMLASGSDPRRNTNRLQFPITNSQANWIEALESKRLSGLSPSSVATIEAAQPYNRSDRGGEMLTRLRDLNNPDKHRRLNLAIFAIQHPNDIIIGPIGPSFRELILYGEPLYDGAKFVSIEFSEPQPPPVDMKLDLTMRVALADDPPVGDALVKILADIREEVLRLLRELRPS